jgi:hypothetical protein
MEGSSQRGVGFASSGYRKQGRGRGNYGIRIQRGCDIVGGCEATCVGGSDPSRRECGTVGHRGGLWWWTNLGTADGR